MLRFGCIADDFTGASDAASVLVKGGMSVQLFNGIPLRDTVASVNTDAVVIALKSRTQETKAAVKDSLEAVNRLKERGAKQFGVMTITMEDGWFIHEGQGYFHEDGQEKYFTIAKGEEWTGGDVFDDYC